MRTLKLPSGESPAGWGEIHGESFRHEIAAIADIRLHLAVTWGQFSGPGEVLELAAAHVPVLDAFDGDLAAELWGIARGADISPALAVVLNCYTDLRDIASGSHVAHNGGCSVIYARTDAGPMLAQTWDMHATAIPYVMMLEVPEREDAPAAWLFSLTGCLGMAGLSSAGVGLTINNLPSTDARVGAVWPAIVRRALRERTAAAAKDAILAAPIGSGHCYLVADERDAYAVETSGTRREVVFAGEAQTYLHTNHCLSDAVAAHTSKQRESPTSRPRLSALEASISARAPVSAIDLWERLGTFDGTAASLCQLRATAKNPHGPATCGAISMDLAQRRALAAPGLIHRVPPETFTFDEP